MKELWNIYHHEIPYFLKEFMELDCMKRLDDVGMNCGVEYTDFVRFKNIRPYSRFVHSVGVALIVYHFTNDIKQTIAGLLHDISTPVFAHTIDFLNGDHIHQESTESNTKIFIESKKELIVLLNKYHLSIDDICDYHQYYIADKQTPCMCADRLEYSLGNMYNYNITDLKTVKLYYDHLYVNKEKEELAFDDLNVACMFTKDVFKTSKVYICDEDRYAMEVLAKLIKDAIDKGVLTFDDLYTTETEVISKLKNNRKWKDYCHLSYVKHDKNGIKIEAKKQYMIPLYKNIRVNVLSKDIEELKERFLNISFDYYLTGY